MSKQNFFKNSLVLIFNNVYNLTRVKYKRQGEDIFSVSIALALYEYIRFKRR